MESWKRTYWVVFVANLITAVGMMSFLPFFPSLLTDIGLSDRDEIARWSGLIFGAAPFSAAIMGPIWGSVGDRFGRKPMVLRALFAITLFVGCMVFARTPGQLLALRIGQGVFSGFVPPSITLVSVGAPKADQGRVTGSLQASLPAGMIAGPLVGALIQSTLGIRWVFVFVALASGLSGLFVLLWAEEDRSLGTTLERFSPTSLLAGTLADLRALLLEPRVRWAVLLLFAVQFGLGASNPLMELHVADVWEGDPERVVGLTAILFSALAVASVISNPLWGRWGDRIGHGSTLLCATFSSGIALGLHALVPGFALLFVLRLLMGVFSPGANVAAFGLAATETPVARRGNAFGAVFSARALAVSLGGILGGWLASQIGIDGLFLVGGGAMLLGALLGRSRLAG